MDFYKTLKYIKDELIKKGADDVVASMGLSRSSQIKFSNNQVNTTMTWDSMNAGVFVSYKKRIVTTNFKEFDKKAIDSGIKLLIKFAENGRPNKDYMGIAEGPFEYKKVEGLYDKKIENLGDKSVDLVEAGINAGLEKGAKRMSGVFEHSFQENYLLTSRGVEASNKSTNTYFSSRAFFEKDSSGHQVCNSRILKDLDVESCGRFAADIAVKAKNPVEGKVGSYDVLFEPMAFACIFQTMGEAASVFSVESGLSYLGDMIGKKVANENVNIYDNGMLDYGLASSSYDAEGMPTQDTLLVDKGVLKTYLHNASTAKRYKVKSTGNAGLIAPEPSNLVLKPGELSRDEMFKGFNGLYITNVWYTRFQNYATGDFSTIPRDGIFLVKDGEIIESLKNIRLSDNVLNILNNISTIGKESKQILSWEVDVPCVIPLVVATGLRITKPK